MVARYCWLLIGQYSLASHWSGKAGSSRTISAKMACFLPNVPASKVLLRFLSGQRRFKETFLGEVTCTCNNRGTLQFADKNIIFPRNMTKVGGN